MKRQERQKTSYQIYFETHERMTLADVLAACYYWSAEFNRGNAHVTKRMSWTPAYSLRALCSSR